MAKTCKECCGFSGSENRCLLLGGRGIAYINNEACRRFSEKKPKLITNGDKIRQMSNEELILFKEKAYCFYCAYHVEGSGRFTENCDKPQGKTCIDGFRIWLNAPAESEGEG